MNLESQSQSHKSSHNQIVLLFLDLITALPMILNIALQMKKTAFSCNLEKSYSVSALWPIFTFVQICLCFLCSALQWAAERNV